ncbi:AAA family ATPase [Levilactobacillus lanxiensis]|uniref:AAA family ATPase n=1 Tax=Levilactobacillus lanxiensis TaxID=2799568 RepID=A0ABW4D037_9LACO|nr:AAA family ATPase [Levilactobacillus lanxiensis]
MRIRNLGPISDATIHLNNLTLFIGDNGTGKTLAAYSVFAFRNWLERFVPDLLSEQDFDELRTNGTFEINIKKLREPLIQQLIETFNALNEDGQYFEEFFKDKTTYEKNISKITIDKFDVESFEFVNDATLRKIVFSYSDTTSKRATFEGEKRQDYSLTFKIDGDLLQILQEETSLNGEGFSPKQALVQINRLIEGFLADNISLSTYLPAERIGINVFRTRLNNQVIEESFANPLAANTSIERYPYPIEAYIKYLNSSLDLLDKPYTRASPEESRLLKKLVPGTFSFDETANRIKYQTSDSNSKQIDFSLVSSSLKSLLGIDLFLKSTNPYNWLIVDEPEMNLHPTRQKLVMDLLYHLAESDEHVVISTHSDYLVKELINLMLESKIANKKQHVGMSKSVSVYEFSDSGVRDLGDISSPNQAGLANFDHTTDEINNHYYDLLEQIDGEDGDSAGE